MSDASARTGSPLARWAKLALPWILTLLIIEYFRRTRNLGAIGSTLAHANWWAYIALMLPYALILLAVWVVLFVIWFLLGLPMGPGYPVTL